MIKNTICGSTKKSLILVSSELLLKKKYCVSIVFVGQDRFTLGDKGSVK